MKLCSRFVTLVSSVALLATPMVVAAQNATDCAALYKAKCAVGHRRDGAGKNAYGPEAQHSGSAIGGSSETLRYRTR